MRFHKSVKLAPGVKVNLNAKSVSMTAGVRGANVTVNNRGQRTVSAGIPGSGLSYRDTRKIGGRTAPSVPAFAMGAPVPAAPQITKARAILSLVLALVITSPIAFIGGVFVYAFWSTASSGIAYLIALIVTAAVVLVYLLVLGRLLLLLLGADPKNPPR
jgi:hypothetical protein